jgi:hypothetical protein
MLAKLNTFSLLGIDALPVEVEVDVSPSGLPKMVLVGLPEAAVKESTHRVEGKKGIRPMIDVNAPYKVFRSRSYSAWEPIQNQVSSSPSRTPTAR